MRIVANQLSSYQEQAERYIEDLERLGWNDPSKPLEVLIDSLMKQFSIVVRTDASLTGRDSATFFINDRAGNPVKILLIDKKFSDSPKKDMYYKKYIVHELGHFVRNHETAKLRGWKDRQFVQGLETTIAQQEKFENEAEVTGSVLLFWPDSLFKRKWDECEDLQVVSDYFKAELDCCAKYIFLRNLAPDHHYLKYNVSTREFDDFYIPDCYDPIFRSELNNLEAFRTEQTALGKCIMANAITVKEPKTEGKKRFNAYLTVYCKVYYRPKSDLTAIQEDDKAICIGEKITE